jgi:DNA-binding IclR family transcriptional regulator
MPTVSDLQIVGSIGETKRLHSFVSVVVFRNVELIRGGEALVKMLSIAEGAAGREAPLQAGRPPASASVGVISKVLRILEVLQNSPGGLGLKAICDETGINKSTAHRFLRHLERESYLLRTEAGAYLIGPRLTQISACTTRSATLQVAARPILADLWRSTQETVNLGVLDQGTLLYVDVMESPHEFRLVSRIGTRRSLHVAALGKAVTAFLPAAEYERVLNGIVFQRMTPKTIANLAQLRAELDKVRRQGYAIDNEEALLGCRCVSAPILNNERVAIGAVSVAGPVMRVGLAQVPALAKLVKAAANAVSTAMGFTPRERTTGNSRTSQKSASAWVPRSAGVISFH